MKSTNKPLSSSTLNRRFGGSFQDTFFTTLQKKYCEEHYHEFTIDEISDTIINYNFPKLLLDANIKKPIQLYLFNLQTAIYNRKSHRFIQVREFVLGDRKLKKQPNNWTTNPHLNTFIEKREVVIELLNEKECWIFTHLTILN